MTTKQKILDGARREFQSRGFSGARMQAISDASGVNKALLHYHFGSKEELFDAVLKQSFLELIPVVLATLNSDLPLKQKLETVVGLYLDNVAKNPDLPLFVITELNRNPAFIKEQFKQRSLPPVFVQQIEEAVNKGLMIRAEPIDVMADIMGLCIMPLIGKPILQHVSKKNNAQYKEFLAKRKMHATQLLIRGLFL